MRKSSTSFLCFFLFITSLQAQKDIAVASVRYTLTHIMDTTQPENPLKENMILYLGKNMSNYTSYDRIEQARKQKGEIQAGKSMPRTAIMNGKPVDLSTIDKSTIISVNVNNGIITVNAIPDYALRNSYFKNQSASKISFIGYADQKLFTVEEKIQVINWTITQEIKEINGLSSQKAIGDFKGRTYEAWFTSQLPYSNGPWKLGGLPGLIIEASDTRKEVIFKMVSFENTADPNLTIEIPITATKTTPKEFKQYQDALEKDRQATVGSSSGEGILGSKAGVTVTLVPHSEKPVKQRQMNNPIEKEITKK